MQLVFLSSCCVLNPQKCSQAESDMKIINVETKQERDLSKQDFEKISDILLNKGNYEPPFKRNPFLKDYEIIGGKDIIEFSTYNSKFRIVKGGKERIGQYDRYYLKKVNAFLKIEKPNNKIGVLYSEEFDLVKVSGTKKRTKASSIDNYPIINTTTKNIEEKESNRIKELILNVSENNALYNLDNSSGTAAIFSPNFAIRFKSGIDILISLRMNKVRFYENEKVFKAIKINPNSEEYKELSELSKKIN